MSKKIIHFIDSIGRGGSEMVVLNTVNELKNHKNIVVYLHGPEHLKNEFEDAVLINLNLSGWKSILKIIRSLEQIINKHNIDVLHSHSFFTNIISRLLRVKNLKIINSYHFADFQTLPNQIKRKSLIFIDVLTNRKEIIKVCVSNYLKRILENSCGYKDIIIIDNFIESPNIKNSTLLFNRHSENLKLIAIGSLKPEKNYKLFIEAFKTLKAMPVQMDIYGDGSMLHSFNTEIYQLGIKNLRFMGNANNIQELLPEYHAYCMASYSETFGLATLEAINYFKPLILSDIPANREIAENLGCYFDNRKPEDFVEIVSKIIKGNISLEIDEKKYRKIIEKYSKKNSIDKLNDLYSN